MALIKGHISRPVFGEGRQAPDRQMLFVNSRPCGLPQIAKVFNEVYKSYNITQSPFIFADIQLDSNAYDVNVSPDKRTILLHEQNELLQSLKDSLIELFEKEEQTVPQSTLPRSSIATTRSHAAHQSPSGASAPHDTSQIYCQARPVQVSSVSQDGSSSMETSLAVQSDLIAKFATRNVIDRRKNAMDKLENASQPKVHDMNSRENESNTTYGTQTLVDTADVGLNVINDVEIAEGSDNDNNGITRHVQDFNARLASQQLRHVGAGMEKPTAEREKQDSPAAKSAVENQTFVFGSNEHEPVVPSVDTTSQQMRSTERSVKRRKIDAESWHTGLVDFVKASSFARGLALFSADSHGMPTIDAGIRHEKLQTAASEETLSSDDDQTDDENGSRAIDTNVDATHEGSASEERGVDSTDEAVFDSYQPTDIDYMDEDERKHRQEAKIRELVEQAETDEKLSTKMSTKRANDFMSSRVSKDTTVGVQINVSVSIDDMKQHLSEVQSLMHNDPRLGQPSSKITDESYAAPKVLAEETLSLTISKPDFAKMRIVGQFNLGFILATRPQVANRANDLASTPGDLFIIDQHASDEIYNFHRLSATTVLTPQPLARPHVLELTAIEEETILEHGDMLEKNGFTIATDTSGMTAVGRRCTLLTLPTSRETVFDLRDLEELLALLGEAGTPATSSSARDVIRPSRVRKMLAMRACRSSVMVGKTMTPRGMRSVVDHMGMIERPWNCPHGRPTMRHLADLSQWVGWQEDRQAVKSVDWKGWLHRRRTGSIDAGASTHKKFHATSSDEENQ